MSPESNFATLSFPTLRTDRQDAMDAQSRAVGHSAGVADYELPLAVPAATPLPAAA